MRRLLNKLRTAYRRRFPPRRRVVDHDLPILRWRDGESVAHFRDRLECGHLLDPDDRRREVRRCWKCSRNLPADSRVRVRPGQRSGVTA